MRIRTFLFPFLFLGTVSCTSFHQENHSTVFNQYAYDSEIYKTALTQHLKTGKHLSYYFKAYFQEADEEYILVDVRSRKLSAQCKLLVDDWSRFEKIRQTKGKGYGGAKLKGLTIEIEKRSGKTNFVCKDIRRIID